MYVEFVFGYSHACGDFAQISSRLAVTNGLHRTQSLTCSNIEGAQIQEGPLRISSLKSSNSLKRTRATILPPPRDAYELGDRIVTFRATVCAHRPRLHLFVPPKSLMRYDLQTWTAGIQLLWAGRRLFPMRKSRLRCKECWRNLRK